MLCTVFLCSCATYPIEKSAHPIAIGVDYDSTGKYYTQIGLYCIFDGEQLSYRTLKASGATVAQAGAEKAGYSFEAVNYSMLGAIALGQGALENGVKDALYPFLQWSLPSGDILLCASDRAEDLMLDPTLPELLQSASSDTLMPRVSLPDSLDSLCSGSPLVLPYITLRGGLYMDGAVILQDGVFLQRLSREQTRLWALLFYPRSSGSLTAAGISVQFEAVRRLDAHRRRITLELSVRLLSPGSADAFRDGLLQSLDGLMRSLKCDALLLRDIFGADYAETEIQLIIRKY